MAKVTDLTTLAKTSAASTDFLLVSNSASGQSKKITLESLFPSVSTAGTSSETLYNSATLTNKNQIAFKGIKSGDTGLLTVGTTSSNLVLTVLEAGIDLSLCNNDTSGFVTGVDFTGTVTGVNTVTNGGTGLSTIAKGAMLYASATDTVAATAAMSTNGQLLIGNATNGYPSVATLTAGAGMTITNGAGAITLAASIANAESNIDMRNAANNATYNIDLVGGTAFISGDGTAEGLTVDNDGKVFIGQGTPTAAFADTLNIKGGIRFTNTDAPTIKPSPTTSSTAGQPLTIEGGYSAGAAAGHLYLKGGTASGNGAGGSIIMCAGRDSSGSSDGTVQLKTYTGGEETPGLTVESEGQNVTVETGNLAFEQGRKGLVFTNKGTVTQATNHTTGVTINATAGVITLAAVALSAATNAEFTVTNDTVTANSMIMLTVQDENTTDNAQLTACTHTIGSGSFKISIHNPAATGSTSTTASKIHFLVIN
tara:strand:+ start:5947 stop:7392 length:1446 start_codon:yes stop_codon:yes gene_type:complete